VMSARGEISADDGTRLDEVARLFEADGKALPTPDHGPRNRRDFAA
jgi:hypothetical protein